MYANSFRKFIIWERKGNFKLIVTSRVVDVFIPNLFYRRFAATNEMRSYLPGLREATIHLMNKGNTSYF